MPQKLNFIYNKKKLFHIFVYVPAGSIYEDENVLGISHMLEHMLFKHTKKYHEKELLEEITTLGGSYNAVTDRDTTFFYIMTHMDNYKKAIDIIHEITRRPVFTQKELELERKVVFEEINKHMDNKIKLFNLSYLAILDVENKYVRPVEGSIKTLKSITVDHLNKYFDDTYNDVVVTMNCDVGEKKEVEKYANAKFGASSHLSFTKIKEIYNINFKSRIIAVKDTAYQYSTHILFPSFPREMARENIILNFIRYCLASSGLYSILTYELRSKQGLVYNVHSMCESYRYIGIFRLIISTTSKETIKIVSLILNALQKLRENGMTKKMFNYYKKGIINQQKYAQTNDEFRTILHSEASFYGSNMDDDEYVKIVKNITINEVITVAKQIFDMKKIGIFTSGQYKSTNVIENSLIDAVQNFTVSVNTN